MLSQNTLIEIKKDEKSYRFYCESTSPLGEVFDVLTEMRCAIVEKINEHNAKIVEKINENNAKHEKEKQQQQQNSSKKPEEN